MAAFPYLCYYESIPGDDSCLRDDGVIGAVERTVDPAYDMEDVLFADNG
jgi:hypothetical protein